MKPMMKKRVEKSPKSNNLHSIRLNRYLAMSGVASRRNCDQYILNGRVEVNGKIVTEMGTRIKQDVDKVRFDGRPVKLNQKAIYILLNKPPRTVCTVKDEKARKTVIDLIKMPERLFPVGRLDYNTTGSLLITNDGEITYYLAHPRFKVKKIYHALLNKLIRPIDLHHLQNGVELDSRTTAPCKIKEIRIISNCSYLEIEMHEGRNRQIKRMFQSLGYEVEELERVEFAGLRTTGLKQGEWRNLSASEIGRLKMLVNTYGSEIA
jgi:pseudouridine synthase